MVKVTLLKPLNGQLIGTEAEFGEQDVKRLEGLGAVKRIPQAPLNKKTLEPKNKAKA